MDAINWHSFFFYLFAAVACSFAVAVVLTSNIVRMAFYLVLSLGATAGLFFIAGADFVGSMQLLIYVGGTLVLLVFGVMLTAQGPFISMRTAGGDWILALVLSGCLLAVLIPAALSIPSWRNETPKGEEAKIVDVSTQPPTATRIGLGLLGARVEKLGQEANSPATAGMAGYLLPFEIVSLHLLVVLIGAAYLARTKRRSVSR